MAAFTSPCRVGIVLFLVVVLILSGSAVQAGTVVVGGTGSALAMVRQMGDRFTASHPDITVEVPPSLGSNGGIRAVTAGAIDVAVSARPLTADEIGGGMRAVAWGRTPFLVVVSPRVHETAITADGLADILAGRRRHWADGEPIVPILRPRSDSDFLLLASLAPVVALALEEARSRPGMMIAMTDQECAAMVAGGVGTIGAMTLAQLRGENLPVRPLIVDGNVPDLDSLAAGRYPLFRQYWLVVGPTPRPEALALIAFLTAPEATPILRSLGVLAAPRP